MVSTTGLFVFLLVVVIQAVPEGYTRYDNHKLVLLTVTEEEDVKFLSYQQNNNRSLDFWIEPRIGQVSVLVGPDDYPSFTDVLEKRGIQYEKINDNIQDDIDIQWEEFGDRDIFGEGSADAFAINQYNTIQDIHAYLRTLPSNTRYSAAGLNIELVTVGHSYNEWPLLAVKISTTKVPGTKNTVFFNGGIHAREWISPATVLYMLYSICENYTTGGSDEFNAMIDRLNIIVLPVLNPDGYEYTMTNTRLWRKTRRPNTGSTCIGTDPNRNWNYQWGRGGSSSDPCSETFMGRQAADQPEVAALQSYLQTLKPRGYIDFHAYSQLWLSAWGWTNTLPTNNAELQRVGNAAAQGIRSNFGRVFRVGPIYTTIYQASGSSVDYTFANPNSNPPGTVNAFYSYAPELRPDANASNGFVLPAVQIIPSGLETFEALKVWMGACVPLADE